MRNKGICSTNESITLGIADVARQPATTSGSVNAAGSKREKTGPEPKREDDDAHERTLESAPICVSESPAANAMTGWNVFVTAFSPLMKNITSTPTQTASGSPVIERTIGERGGDSTTGASVQCRERAGRERRGRERDQRERNGGARAAEQQESAAAAHRVRQPRRQSCRERGDRERADDHADRGGTEPRLAREVDRHHHR